MGAIPGEPGIASLPRQYFALDVVQIPGESGSESQDRCNPGRQPHRIRQVVPRDPDTTPAGQFGDPRLALLLTEDSVDERLSLTPELRVLLTAVELEPDLVLRPS